MQGPGEARPVPAAVAELLAVPTSNHPQGCLCAAPTWTSDPLLLSPDRELERPTDNFFTEAVNDGRKARNGLSQAEPQFKLN